MDANLEDTTISDINHQSVETKSTSSKPNPNRKTPRKTAPRNKTADFDETDIFNLIAAVESRETLWNIRSGDNKDSTKRESCWRAVAEEFAGKFEVQQLKQKWQGINCTLRQILNTETKTKSGQGSAKRVVWKYWNALAFVRQAKIDYMVQSESSLSIPTNLPTNDNEPDPLHEEASLESIDVGYSGIASASSSRSSCMADGRAKRRAHPTERLLEIKRQALQSLQTCVTGINDARSQLGNKDEFDIFAEMVGTTLRSMPVRYAQQTKVELNCLLAEKNNLAARAELRKLKQKKLSEIYLQAEDGEMAPYYAIGENDEPFDPNNQCRLFVYDVNGELVESKSITEPIRALFANPNKTGDNNSQNESI